MTFLWGLLVAALIGVARAGQKCQSHNGGPLMYNGKKCASTTNYHDGFKGACGCGTGSEGGHEFAWNGNSFTAAANDELFEGGWCGASCGKCVRLTTTGGFVDGQGVGPRGGAGVSKVFMITNKCPNEFPNLSWCSQSSNRYNQFGYGWHFDLMNGAGQVTTGLGWTNPEVTWEWADCDQGHREDYHAPTRTMYNSCECKNLVGK